MKKITLKELGSKLPVPVDGCQDLTFSFKSWGLDEEKKIGEMKRKSNFMGPFISQVLSEMLVTCCGQPFDTMKPEEKQLFLYQLPMMDVLYLWIYLRYDQLDENLRMDIPCPGCGRTNKDYTASLDGLDVDVPEEEDGPIRDYKLKKPFKWDDGEASVLKFIRTPWSTMDKADDEVTTNQGMIMELMFKKSLVKLDEQEGFVDFEKLVKLIRKKDIEYLSKAVEKHNGGPSLAIEGKCNFCPTTFYNQLNWSYDHFFGTSSLPLD